MPTVLSETRDLRGMSFQQDAEADEFQPLATTALDLAAACEIPGPVVGRLLETLIVRDDESWQDLISLDGFDE